MISFVDKPLVFLSNLNVDASLPYSKKMYLTEIDAEFKAADTFFPKFDAEKFNDTVIGEYSEKETDYKIHLYERKGELNNG